MTPGHRTIEMCVECAADELRRVAIPGRYVVVLRTRRNCPSKHEEKPHAEPT